MDENFEIRQVIVDKNNTIVFDNADTDAGKVIKILGIQAPAGTQFVINGGGTITMEFYGQFELDMNEIGGEINKVEIISIPFSTLSSSGEVVLMPVIIDMIVEGRNT